MPVLRRGIVAQLVVAEIETPGNAAVSVPDRDGPSPSEATM
jgi:hypothetical protein